MKNIPFLPKDIYSYILILLIASISSLLMLIAVYAIPVKQIRTNIIDSLPTLQSIKKQNFNTPVNKFIDIFSDCLFINNSGFLGRNIILDALTNPRAQHFPQQEAEKNIP